MDEQSSRFESIRKLSDEVSEAVNRIRTISNTELTMVDNDSANQGEQLQRLQQSAGTAVQALTELSELARHARSYQAQAHLENKR